jgi:hypothetical protein
MRVKCDLCPAVAHGTIVELIKKGWARVVIINPVHHTLTRCPEHQDTMNDAIVSVLDGRKGEILEENRIGTVREGKSSDYEW